MEIVPGWPGSTAREEPTCQRGVGHPLCNYSFCTTPEIWTRKCGSAGRVEGSAKKKGRKKAVKEEEEEEMAAAKGG